MLNVTLDEAEGIAILEPVGNWSAIDFESASNIIDPHIEKSGKLNGIIIHAESCPGWDSFSVLLEHLKFINEHHEKIFHVAIAMDTPIDGLAKYVANHFVNAQIRSFSFDELEKSKNWILGRER